VKPVERLLERLERVKRSGEGWTALCPAHEDRNPSLSVKEGEDGRALVHCHAGCSKEDIVTAVGLTIRDLFPTHEAAETGLRTIVDRYPYVDEQGELLFEAVRFEPKDFRQRRPDGDGGWIWKLEGSRRVLYRLPQVVEARQSRMIVVVEGEKDVHALEQVGLVATCNPMGAGKWRPEYAATLAGARHVVVIPDDDAEGRKHALEVARSLVDTVEVVRVVPVWPKGETKADVSDWLAPAGEVGEREQAAQLLKEIIQRTPAFTLETAGSVSEILSDHPRKGVGQKRFWSAREFASLAPSEVPWVARPWCAQGALTEVEGKIKAAGKTTWVLALAAAVLDGTPFMGEPTERSPIVYLTEQASTTFREALRRADLLDRDDFHVLFRLESLDLSWHEVVGLAAEKCVEVGARLLVVDTLGPFAGLEGEAENSAGEA
jgi:putative DNA primase/helicase